ncbi:hypothetical protein ACFYY3_27530 [Streptomyces sp. NPDC001812]|uniref:hypothetical protein n=1 Tax=Streptomyces sp. NPDC001812 TaxID=3364611 RepID=UPI00368B87CD
MNNDGQISLRMAILLIVGGITVYVSIQHPAIGVAIGIGVVVMTLANQLIK